MAWTAPVDPVAGTVITVAYAVSNILNPIRWLRIMTGNADPPGSAYVAVSSGPSGATWSKVTADVLASGASVGNIGYTPVNRAGDALMTGSFSIAGGLAATGLVAGANGVTTGGGLTTVNGTGIICDGALTAASYGGGSLAAGRPNFQGIAVGTNGVTTGGGLTTVNGTGIICAGALTAASYGGGSLTTGAISVLGLGVGTSGIAVGGPIIGAAGSSLSVAGGVSAGGNIGASGNISASGTIVAAGQVSAGSYAGGSTAAGSPSVLGLSVGTGGVAVAGIVTVYGGEQVYSPTNPPPMAGGGASVPSGLIAFIATGAVPTGWSFYPPASGRVIVGAGSASVTNPQTFAVGNNYGSDWAHAHTPNTFTVTGAATFGPSDMTQASVDVNGLATAGGVNLNTTGHRHGLSGASAAVSGSATGATAGAVWVPPAHALNAIIKS